MLNKCFFYVCLILGSVLFFSCDKEVSTSPPDAPIPTGKLYIASDPAGAKIYINDRITGKVTPDSLLWLKEGTYKVTLKLPLYSDTTFFLKAFEGQKVEAQISYSGNPSMLGAIKCTSEPPNAEIFMNDQLTDKRTPYTFKNLIPGHYKLKVRFPGYRDDSLLVTLESGRTVSTDFTLTDTTLWVDYKQSNSPMPSNNINCIAITNNNTKWIGTADKGLVSFDGSQWKVYDQSNSLLPSPVITCLATNLMATYGKDLWVGTPVGLVYFNGSAWKLYTTSNSELPDNIITSIVVDWNGDVWIGTLQGLACLTSKGKWIIYQTSNSKIPGNWITKVTLDQNYRLWVGTMDDGVAYFDRTNWSVYTKSKNGFPGNTVSALSSASVGGTWVGFACKLPYGADVGGISVFDNGRWTNISGLPSNYIENIYYYNTMRWVCTRSGLVKFNQNTMIEILNKSNSKLPSDYIKDVVIDGAGVMWIATYDKGFVKYKPN
ncbi:MAG: PEGA domain-containing protein [Bacillota bacterium]